MLSIIIINKTQKVLYPFVPNKSFDEVIDISPKNCILFKNLDSKFLYIDIWFADENSKLLEIK